MTYYPTSAFNLDIHYTAGVNTANNVIKGLKGRACGKPHDYALLAKAVALAGKGNYVETGTLFGASALVAAITKKMYNLDGNIYCVDPLNGYYGDGNKDASGLVPSVDILMENATKFDVADIIIPIAKKSVPFPEELKDKEFSVAYIDGNHWKDYPTKDWDNLNPRTTEFIMFDNYDFIHPSVVKATIKAVSNPEWKVAHVSSISFILQKNPNMSDPHAWAGES